MGDEAECAVEADRGHVVGVDVEHADGDAATGERLEPRGGQRPTESATVPARVGADHVDLAERGGFARRVPGGDPWSTEHRHGPGVEREHATPGDETAPPLSGPGQLRPPYALFWGARR